MSFQLPFQQQEEVLVAEELESGETEPFFGVHKFKRARGVPKCTKLKVKVMVTWGDGSSQLPELFVDTGAEVNLVNPKVVSPDLFVLSQRPVRLGVANSHLLPGGSRDVSMRLGFEATQIYSGKQVDMSLP